jgi:hypothetical protein
LYNDFRKKYKKDGPAIMKMALTALRGYNKALKDYTKRSEQGFSWNGKTLSYEKISNPMKDEFMELRIAAMRNEALRYRPALLSAMIFSPNRAARKKARETIKLFKQTFGKPVIKDNLKSAVLLATACVEYLRIALSKISGKEGIIRQPSLHRVEYESRIIPDKSCIIKNNAVKTAVL